MRIGGVPEHFNLPWRLAIEEGIFSSKGIELEWTDYPGGTGAMNKALREGDLDIATILTEGIVADIINGNPSQLLKIHVQTPLNWGIFVNQSSAFQQVDDLRAARFAISRLGSGSQLMAYVNALQRGWNLADLSMVVLNNLEGMRKGLRDNEADVLMWERVMTQPYVDSGELRRVGICPTPWPGFVLVARNEVIANKSGKLKLVCDLFNEFVSSFKERPGLDELIAQRYSLPLADVQQWITETEWATTNNIEVSMLDNVMETLQKAGTITGKIPATELITTLQD
ncbi:substrate-binding domain-containing protein [Xanthocytophaga flava]|uniref:substrate-binding domain-containing protein n=1 Tax=Xanthocytophaga flava TaxID=3048013 RepID=UPI0028D46AAA|nr:substrate-binding domain-containing protein [Xanthocytophaga flavus]MDJ1470141.1 substrate-binding domain-containing protein [Xanthocytophaga flavus]